MVTVLSQGDAYHSARARDKRERWLEQFSTPELQVYIVFTSAAFPKET